MGKRFTRVLAWLLIVALPMQGYAAATMVNCSGTHHEVAVDHAHDASANHDPGHADHLSHTHAVPDAGDGVDTQEGDHANLASTLTCSACAACCVGIALPITLATQTFAAPASEPYFQRTSPTVDVLLKGPDKPPRFILV
jgi:hypothetical protein